MDWVQREWPSDANRTFELSERCTRALKDDERYRDDLRYLKVWIAYADRVAHPAEIFRHLHKLHIGRTLALSPPVCAFLDAIDVAQFRSQLQARAPAPVARFMTAEAVPMSE